MMEEFIERFKDWLDSQEELGKIEEWDLIQDSTRVIGIRAGNEGFFVSIDQA